MSFGAPSTVSRVPCTPQRLPDLPNFTEEQRLAFDRARNDAKGSPDYRAPSDRFALEQQIGRAA
ncbi:hypothetical protein [Variovorax sp. PMC12]|uniref:hypothetical protein n=1 Tax=Variovorax sp. PMC12 TaxID=2126319 RepID=UPI000D129EBC|nr:hypothetical protein [Variovorax sp. PMC12]AVQ84265.1 hypothetical protein C4F17_26780 [Variovorax sp. PMC12]